MTEDQNGSIVEKLAKEGMRYKQLSNILYNELTIIEELVNEDSMTILEMRRHLQIIIERAEEAIEDPTKCRERHEALMTIAKLSVDSEGEG